MQIKIKVIYHFNHIRMATIKKKKKVTSIGEDTTRQTGTECIIGKNIKWHSHFGEKCDSSSKY